MTATSAFQIETIGSLSALLERQLAYDAFLDRVQEDWSFYYRYPFIKTSLDLSKRNERLSFVFILQGETLVAVAPFVQILQEWSRFWIKRLSFIGTGIKDLANQYPTILIDPDVDQGAVLNTLADYFDSRASDWDQLDLSGLADATQLEFFRSRMKNPSIIALDPGFQTVFADGLDEVIDKQLPKSRMREVRRLSRKILRDHPRAQYQVERGLTEAQFDEIFALHSARQQEKRSRGAVSSQSFYDDPERYRSMKARLLCFAEITDLRVYRLTIEDQLVAFNLTIRSGTTEYGLFMAFDQAYASYSPSKLLMLHIMQRLDEEGIVTTIDHMSGPSMMKKDFCNRDFARHRLVAYNHRRLTSLAKHNCFLATRGTIKFGSRHLRAAKTMLRSKTAKPAKAA